MARARPRSVLVEEKYRVQQEISRNSDVRLDAGATGKIEVVVPYDGHKYVSRDTVDDVQYWAARNGLPARPLGRGWTEALEVEAQIGHLVVTNHQDTDLAEATGGSGRTMAVALRIPVRSGELRTDSDLIADRHVFRQVIPYHPAPDQPKLIPVQIHVEVTDPGSVSIPKIDPDGQSDLGSAVDLSQQYMTFRSYLQLRLRVQVDLQGRRNWDPPTPVVRRLSLSLPSGLTLAPSSVELLIANETSDGKEPGEAPTIVQHDPKTASIEWFDVPTRKTKDQKADGPKTYLSPPMFVRIHEPGELFNERELLVRADVETDGVLLSGADVRLFDARGRRVRESGAGGRGHGKRLTVRSLVAAETTVVLGDAFAKRTFEPQQSFHFDEVIPAPLRVQDIMSALMDLRFAVWSPELLAKRSKSSALMAYIEASRGEEPDAIKMRIFVVGRQQRTERQSQHPGGRRFTSKLDTGDLTLIVHGQAPRDSSQLVHEINELQLGLRDRFRRLKAQR